ncbi:MAG: MgtC/SapB family protein [Muribaculaceae bacterium]|nr:MgtC/SapB family protein [Muribaculaceae bacterium]
MDFLTSQLCSLDVNAFNASFRLLLALLLGAVVGAERKHKGHVAGIRTFSLISMGACLAMILSIYVPQEYMGLKNGDPGRIAAQVITGIGFLGGGAMIQQKGAVRGLTTAAGIWITAILGMAVGVGMYLASIICTVFIFLVIVGFNHFEHRIRIGQEMKVISIRAKGILKNIDDYEKILRNEGVRISNFYIEQNFEQDFTEVNLVVLVRASKELMDAINLLSDARSTLSITLSNQIDL